MQRKFNKKNIYCALSDDIFFIKLEYDPEMQNFSKNSLTELKITSTIIFFLFIFNTTCLFVGLLSVNNNSRKKNINKKNSLQDKSNTNRHTLPVYK